MFYFKECITESSAVAYSNGTFLTSPHFDGSEYGGRYLGDAATRCNWFLKVIIFYIFKICSRNSKVLKNLEKMFLHHYLYVDQIIFSHMNTNHEMV